jgi:hypothetical protein
VGIVIVAGTGGYSGSNHLSGDEGS